MLAIPLREKSASAVFPAIKTTFMINDQSFLLLTDNGRELCNRKMVLMLD